MNTGRTVFAQVMDFLPQRRFQTIVHRYQGNRKVTRFSCLDQFLCMAFAQLTFRQSLRDIEAGLGAQPNKLYHLGIGSRVHRSTLADANEKRNWRIFAELAQLLIQTARDLYVNDSFGIDLIQTVYAFDSTTIDLCLELFPWAVYQRKHGAIKLHTLLDLRGSIPAFILISTGKLNDVCALDSLELEPGALYILDRGYLDSSRLYRFNQCGAFFITRSRKNTQFCVLKSNTVDKASGVCCDQTIRLAGVDSRSHYPAPLRRVKYRDTQNAKTYVYLTNNFLLQPLTIARLYKARWRVELFFKWIKHHLRIRAFFGTSENAVKTQVWIAVSVYLLVAIMKKKRKLEYTLYTILQILSLHIFEKANITQLLTENAPAEEKSQNRKQLVLFN